MGAAFTYQRGASQIYGYQGVKVIPGRLSNDFKVWIKKLVHSPKARKRLKKILFDAPDAETKVTSEGVEVPVRAEASTYLKALELAWHYAEGKPLTEFFKEGISEGVKSYLDDQTAQQILLKLENAARIAYAGKGARDWTGPSLADGAIEVQAGTKATGGV